MTKADMRTRITFNGESATCGSCRGCGLLLIVTDKAPNGDYKTFHQDPMCPWYLNNCTHSTATGLHVMSAETDPSGTIRVEAVKPIGQA